MSNLIHENVPTMEELQAENLQMKIDLRAIKDTLISVAQGLGLVDENFKTKSINKLMLAQKIVGIFSSEDARNKAGFDKIAPLAEDLIKRYKDI